MLPEGFTFSQNNLQDYIDCPRKFFLRHIARTDWPALETGSKIEQEHLMELGNQFHKMIQQSFLGIPDAIVLGENRDPLLELWWHNFRNNPPPDLPSKKMAEYTLVAPFEHYRITAIYDLIAMDPPEEFCIVDWKTSTHKPARLNLQNRIQTRIYPFLLFHSGAGLNENRRILPENIRMIYWYANDPVACEIFLYSQAQAEKDRIFFSKIILEIASLKEIDFPMTLDATKCSFCKYRSLCDRGKDAGKWIDPDEMQEEKNSFLGEEN